MLALLSGSDMHGLKRRRAWQESSGVVASYPIVSEFGAQNMVRICAGEDAAIWHLRSSMFGRFTSVGARPRRGLICRPLGLVSVPLQEALPGRIFST